MNKRIPKVIVLFLLSLFVISSCSSVKEEAIRYGSDQCKYCKMSIVDKNFGAEMVSKKGKIYKFDSIECLAAFELTGGVAKEKMHSLWVTEIGFSGQLLNLEKATIYHGQSLKSPMGLGFYASRKRISADKFQEKYNSKPVTWDEVKKIVKEAWL